MEKTICFTGKRPRDLYGYDFNDSYMKLIQKLYSWMMDVCMKENVQTSITGGAQGFDQIAFWACTAANIGVILKRFNALSGLSCYSKNVQYFKFFMMLFMHTCYL